jgi:hypothetical protein
LAELGFALLGKWSTTLSHTLAIFISAFFSLLLFYFFFLAVLGLELRAYTLSDSTSPFLRRVFSK